MEFLILNGKTPTHSFKEKGKSWDDVKDFDSVGLIVPTGYLVLDFDTVSDAEIMMNIVEDLDLKCRVVKTKRGIHCYFKNGNIEKCFTKRRLAVGIYSDCKNSNKRSYVKIKEDGKMREVIQECEFEDMQEVPRWLYPISSPDDKFNFKGMGEGDGRNQELFNYVIYLQSKGFKKEEVKEAIHVINQFVFADPLPDHEIELILRDEAFKPDDVIEQQIEESKKRTGFKHNEFGDELIDTFHIITVNNQLYVYDDGYYQQDERIIERKMIEVYPGIKQKDRSEVLSYIRIKTHMSSEDIKVNPYIVNLKNTRLDLRNGKTLDFDHRVIEFARVPVIYNPDAYCEDLDKMLKRVFLDDPDVLDLFEELIGACLLKHSRYQKAFMFYGSGSNGKSTIMDLIKAFIGRANMASIDLDKLTSDKFATAELENKLVNLADDIDNNALKNTGTLKKLFSGNTMLVQRKSERPFMLDPYATHIFSCNTIPRSFDKTNGFYRRWAFVPFNASFSIHDEDFDPMIEDKITTPEAMSYLLNIALRGAQRLIQNRGFTEPEVVQLALEEYMSENSHTLSWVNEQDIDIEYLISKPRQQLYSEFTDWCKCSGIKQNIPKTRTFYDELRNKFGFEKEPQQKGNKERYFRVSID